MTESLVLSLAGGVVGTLLASWGTSVLGSAAAGFVPRINEIGLDWRVLTFALLASVAGGLAFGIGPALRLSRTDASETLKVGERGGGRRGMRRSRDLLVVAECALALTLLTGAGLLLRSLDALQAVNPGFDPSNVLTVRIEFPTEAPPTGEQRTQTSQLEQALARGRIARATQLSERVQAISGVTHVGFSDDLYLGGPGNESITIPGKSLEQMGTGELSEGTLTPGFFAALRVPLKQGRLLTNEDFDRKVGALWSRVVTDLSLAEKERMAIPEPVVVNEAFVRRFFAGENPIGRKFCIDPTNKTYWYEIVGVIGDMHRQGLDRQAIPQYFGPWIPSSNGRADLLIRTAGDPLAVVGDVRAAITQAVPGATIVSVATAEAGLSGFSALRRLQTWLLTIFAGLALVLAAIGIVGLVHFTVSERTREIGVRVALGASPGEVMALIMRQGLAAPLIGILIGIAASLGLTRVLSSVLFRVGPTDLVTFVSVPLLLASIAAVGCWLAGRRALRVDPVRALRDA